MRREREHTGRASACVALACLLAVACACSSNAGPVGGASHTGGESAATAAAPADGRAGNTGSKPVSFELINYTGTALRAVNVSPGDAAGWEENILNDDGLADGASVEIRFSSEEKAGVWDMRVVGVDNRSAEWKGLRLGNVSRVTLSVEMSEGPAGGPVVVAEVE